MSIDTSIDLGSTLNDDSSINVNQHGSTNQMNGLRLHIVNKSSLSLKARNSPGYRTLTTLVVPGVKFLDQDVIKELSSPDDYNSKFKGDDDNIQINPFTRPHIYKVYVEDETHKMSVIFKEVMVLLSRKLNDNYNIETYDDVKNLWCYAGENGDLQTSHSRYFKQLEKEYGLKPPPMEKCCICTHFIKNNMFLRHIETNTLIVVGSCCIKKFMPKEKQGRTCSRCEQPHRNITDNYCKLCRLKLNKNKVMGFGKYSDLTYEDVIQKHPDYVEYVLEQENAKKGLLRFQKYLVKRRTCSNSNVITGYGSTKHLKGENGPNDENLLESSHDRGTHSDTDIENGQGSEIQGKEEIENVKTEIKNEVVGFGKYFDLTYDVVMRKDPGYIKFIEEKEGARGKMLKFQQYIVSVHSHVVIEDDSVSSSHSSE